jgi:restriction endonuclease
LSTLDFSKLAPPRGETFEGLIRLLGERLGMVVEWSGRGADGGRDLIFVERLQGPIKSRSARWLVSCKDNSDSNRSVTERDVGSVRDKLDQHKCDGFLLATTTTASTGLKERLDKLDSAERGRIQTKVWDRFELTRMLLSDECAGLLLQFFPEHHHREAVAKLDAARETVEAQLPRFIVGHLRMYLVSADERREFMSGRSVWPHDANQQAIIDDLRQYVVHGWRLDQAAQKAQDLHLDALMSFCDALILNFPLSAKDFFVELVKLSTDRSVIRNVIGILREYNSFSLSDELDITRKLDSEILYDLYYDIVSEEFLNSHSLWEKRLKECISCDEIELGAIGILELSFKVEEDIVFDSTIELSGTALHYYDRSLEHHMFNCKVQGRLNGSGVVIDSTVCL